MNVNVKLLGRRNGLTKVKRSDGSFHFVRGEVAGTLGQQVTLSDMNMIGRLDHNWKATNDKFHST